MTFTLLILTSPYTHQATYAAYRFAQAAVAVGHTVRQAFFYSDGAAAAGVSITSGDEIDVMKEWQRFAAQEKIELIICETAMNRRAVGRSSVESDKNHLKLGSLSELLSASIASDRTLTFA